MLVTILVLIIIFLVISMCIKYRLQKDKNIRIKSLTVVVANSKTREDIYKAAESIYNIVD